MPQLSAQSVNILDGKVVLTLRPHSKAWQARFRIGDRWLRISTKQAELDKAKVIADDLYLRARYRHEDGQPIISKRFSQVAALAKQKMQTQLDNDEGKSVFKDYIIAINNYLVPFFGSHNVNSIDYALMKEFAAWRKQKMGHEPKASSISTHNSALNRIFDEAMQQGYMTKSQVPVLKNKGVESERRPAFEIGEYRQLYRYMRKWIKAGRDGKSRQMRELLRDYVLILVNTGMRHGTESYGLKWKHISFFEEKGKLHDADEETGKRETVTRKYLLMHVDGKTGTRELVARNSVTAYLKRIHKRTDDIKDIPFDELIRKGVNEEVFRLPDGSKSQSLAQTFEILLRDGDLLVDRKTEQNRTLYSLRHTYATMALVQAGMSIHTLAVQMGTSVAMIEKHYSHLTPRMRAYELSGYAVLERRQQIAKEKEKKRKAKEKAEAEKLAAANAAEK